MKHLKATTKSMPLSADQSTNQNAFARIMELINSLVCQVAPKRRNAPPRSGHEIHQVEPALQPGRGFSIALRGGRPWLA